MATASKRVVVPWDQANDDYTVPEGRYILRIASANVGENTNGDPRVEIDYLVLAPRKHKGRKFRIFYGLTVAPGLRQLRELLQGLGVRVPNKAAALDLSRLEGVTLKALAQVTETKNGGKFQELHEIERHGEAPAQSRRREAPARRRRRPAPEPEDLDDDLDEDLDSSLDDDFDDEDDFDDDDDLDLDLDDDAPF